MHPIENSQAPCVAIIGPANSGKTTLLHLLDGALQQHHDAPLAYVVKGNPDGIGHYLYRAPDLREAVKEFVKGTWSAPTVATIQHWIRNTRNRLEIVLLDFGGRHDKHNREMLGLCSHYIVLARSFSNPEEETEEGLQSWIREAEEANLKPLACIQSRWGNGTPSFDENTGMGVFRGDAATPADYLNEPLIEPLVEKLVAMRMKRPTPYFDLRLPRMWQERDLETLAGLKNQLVESVIGNRRIVLGGGHVPIWAYAAAMHAALDQDANTVVEVFDPKLPGAFIAVANPGPVALPFPSNALFLNWQSEERGLKLRMQVATADKFLEVDAVLSLPNLTIPSTQESIAGSRVIIDGAGPIWLHLNLSAKIRALGADSISHFDGGWKRNVEVWSRRV